MSVKNQCCFRTLNPVHSYTMKWIIENFKQFDMETVVQRTIIGPFQKLILTKLSISMSIGFPRVHVQLDIPPNMKYQLGVEAQVYDTNRKLCYSPPCIILLGGFDVYFKRDFWDSFPLYNEIMLVMKLTFSRYSETLTNILQTPPAPNLPFVGLDALSRDMKKILNSSDSYDVKFNVQGSELFAHKAILSARSKVFENMFNNTMEENLTGVVTVDDIKPHIFKMFLEFVYAGTLENDDFDTATSLYYASDKYEVLELREVCRNILLPKLTLDNAFELFTLADQHGDQEFRRLCREILLSKLTLDKAFEVFTLAEQHGDQELVKEVSKFIKFHMSSNSCINNIEVLRKYVLIAEKLTQLLPDENDASK